MLVDEFAAMPYKQAAESTNGFLADANDYTTNGNYIMPWVTNFQPNVDAYRAALVSAMNQYDADRAMPTGSSSRPRLSTAGPRSTLPPTAKPLLKKQAHLKSTNGGAGDFARPSLHITASAA